MNLIKNQSFDQERALWGLYNTEVDACRFAGEADGESAFKESHDILVRNCEFMLRYPFWHTSRAEITDITMTQTCRAALWYCRDVGIRFSHLGGIKALRECRNVSLSDCTVNSPEFGWFCRDLVIENCDITGDYLLLHSENVTLRNVHLKGKYSFQYCKNVKIYDSILDTKDAFWETEGVTVYNSVVKGEYLAWYSKDLKLVNCHIVGTQPLCYATGLVLENCTMEGCDLSFEYTDVTADVIGRIDSVKNPLSGTIVADAYGEILLDENRRDDGKARVIIRPKTEKSE